MQNTHSIVRPLPWAFLRALNAVSSTRKARRLFRIAAIVTASPVLLAILAVFYINFNRTNLPDLEAFIRFEPPTIGYVYDAHGQVLVELARERRQVIQYRDIPEVVRQAILSAEDENFFSHSGVDYSVFLRVLAKTNPRAIFAHFTNTKSENAHERALLFPQGGSTITQQLVRGYFLQKLTTGENNNTLQHRGLLPHFLACFIGVPSTNKLLRKVEEMRLSLWIEREMQKRYGSKQKAKEELFARYASFIYLGNGRYGFAAASQYYFDKSLESLTTEDAGKAALLAGITKSPGEYAPTSADVQKPLRRRNQILALMAENHFLSPERARRFQQAPIRLAVHVAERIEAPAAAENVLEELKAIGLQLRPAALPDIGVGQLLEGHIQVYSTIDNRIQRIANAGLANGLRHYEDRHPRKLGMVQGSVVVLRNSDSAILAESGGREVFKGHNTRYSDYNRVTQSVRQPGSTMKPIVYLAAFRQGALDLDTFVPDEPISLIIARNRPLKWISNFDGEFKGMIPARQALAESRNAVAVWIAEQVGMSSVLKTARDLGIRTKLQPYASTALGASEVSLLELANAYRVMASGILADPHVIDRIENVGGEVVYSHQPPCCELNAAEFALTMIQEGLRGVVRIPSGTAHALDSRAFPIPVMGKTGTTNNFRDALFVGSTYGPDGITVAVRIGFDDNRTLGKQETGGRAALPVFREIMLKIYQEKLVGPAPPFPLNMEKNIDAYLNGELPGKEQTPRLNSPAGMGLAEVGKGGSSLAMRLLPANPCVLLRNLPHAIYRSTNERGHLLFTND
ncbi:MAG: transglycosylase domain-containing protein [Candidatus Acidiferrum sp.]